MRRKGTDRAVDAHAPVAAVELLEKRVRELQLLHEIGERITSLLSIEALLPEMVDQLRRVLGVEIVSVMLLDPEEGTLRIAAASGLPTDVVEGTRVRLGEGISGEVAAQGQPVLIRDMSQHPRFGRSPYHAQYTTESLLCVPLRVGDRVLGVINVNNKLSGEALDEQDLALVTTFSSQAAMAIENSRLYRNLEDEVARVTAALSRSNEELRRVQEFNESILRNVSSGLLALDLGGRVTKLNAAAASLLGAPEDAPADETLATLFGAEGAREVLERGGDEADGGRREVVARSRYGRELLVGYSTSPLLDAERRPLGVIVIFRDLTQLKKMQADLVRMDRMASLGVLGAGIAHEIRNPLAAIRFNLDFLHESGERPPELEVILKNVERLDGLVKKLLRFARPQPPAFAAQPLAPRVASVVALIAKQASATGVEVVTDFAPGIPDVWIDGPQVEQVVLNIALNGIQSMPHGGRLTLKTRLVPANRGVEPHAQVVVSDEGQGLPPSVAEQIFDPFFTTREEGTGLGLAVAQRIVEEHAGYIEVAIPPQGARGPGTTFLIGFPLAKRRDGDGRPRPIRRGAPRRSDGWPGSS